MDKKKTRTKIDELTIFMIGFGIVIAVVSAYLYFGVRPAANFEKSVLSIVIPISIAAIMVILGFLVKKLRSRTIINLAGLVPCALFAVDLVLFFNPIKLIISAVILLLIMKGCREAMLEAGFHSKDEDAAASATG